MHECFLPSQRKCACRNVFLEKYIVALNADLAAVKVRKKSTIYYRQAVLEIDHRKFTGIPCIFGE